MTLEELERSLPNGLHDAKVSRLHLDYVERTAIFDLAISTGSPEARTQEERDEYKNARLIVQGLQFVVIEPPDPTYAYGEASALLVDTCSSEGRVDNTLLSNLPKGAFARSIFVNEWNGFIHIAGLGARIEWSEAKVETKGKELKAKS